jgi:hypothetical protein
MKYILGIVSVFLFIIAISFFLKQFMGHKEPKNKIIYLQKKIYNGMTVHEFISIFSNFKDTKLKFIKISPQEILIQSPYKFGAKNWNLWIETKDGLIKKAKVREADSRTIHPPRAPYDKNFVNKM